MIIIFQNSIHADNILDKLALQVKKSSLLTFQSILYVVLISTSIHFILYF